MPASRLRLVCLTCSVCLTLLLAALLPTLSHAFAPGTPAHLLELCSAAGNTMAPAVPGDDGTVTPAMTECPCCILHQGAPAIPPSSVRWAPPADLGFAPPRLFLLAPRPLFAWTPALARAPPLPA